MLSSLGSVGGGGGGGGGGMVLKLPLSNSYMLANCQSGPMLPA